MSRSPDTAPKSGRYRRRRTVFVPIDDGAAGGVDLDGEMLARIDAVARERTQREKRRVSRAEVLHDMIHHGLPLCERKQGRIHLRLVKG